MLADHSPKASAAGIADFFDRAWKQRLARLQAGTAPIPLDESFAFYEILHAVRDNLNTDLREEDPHYFKEFPIGHLLSNYPAAFPAAESEYRIPAKMGTGEPDLRTAALARAAELEMVAFRCKLARDAGAAGLADERSVFDAGDFRHSL